MDNNSNTSYPNLDERISSTYGSNINSGLIKGLYDSYVRAFRWASDRIGDNGVISFVSNGSYVDNLAFSGFRRELLKEFNHVYVFNLRGNQRTQGELSRKEGGKVFGSGSRNTICIITLVKHKGQPFDGFVHYKDIGDYKDRETKLKEIEDDYYSISNIDWKEIAPDRSNDWINQKNEEFEEFIPLVSEESPEVSLFGSHISRGLVTARDSWTIGFNSKTVRENMKKFVKKFNFEQTRVLNLLSKARIFDSNQKKSFVEKNVNYDKSNIKWGREIYNLLLRGKPLTLVKDVRDIMYRPFVKKKLYYDPRVLNCVYKWKNIIPNQADRNLNISISTPPCKKDYSALAINIISDIDCMEHAQSIPVEWINDNTQGSLFEFAGFGQNEDTLNDKALSLFKERYGDKSITSSSVFSYIYAVLNSKSYREKYSNNLGKEMPRIPFLKDFWSWSNIGKALIDLHLNYENAKPYAGVKIEKNTEDYKVTKIRYLLKDRKDTIIFNDHIIISNIPLKAYDYVVNGRSPIDWVLDQYQYTVDKESRIIDDPNLYDEEKGGKYVFDLILSLITVSLETQKLIKELPEYKEI